jgi:hypothetical protein
VALLHCEHQLGGAWAYAPGRWETSDGHVPVRIVWATFMALRLGRARDVLDTARGIGLAMGGEDAGKNIETAFDEAYPGDG